jgi:hypothetical protein
VDGGVDDKDVDDVDVDCVGVVTGRNEFCFGTTDDMVRLLIVMFPDGLQYAVVGWENIP